MTRLVGGYAFSNSVGASCSGRCFAVTKKGYLALVPRYAVSGDMVCLTMGAAVPFLLRRHDQASKAEDKCFKLVGECYVHGMMDGEMVGPESEREMSTVV